MENLRRAQQLVLLGRVHDRISAETGFAGDPSVIAIRVDRIARTSIRVALRQLKAANGMSPSLMTWLSAHERPDQIEMEEQTRGYD
jgi:hypothetical protein